MFWSLGLPLGGSGDKLLSPRASGRRKIWVEGGSRRDWCSSLHTRLVVTWELWASHSGRTGQVGDSRVRKGGGTCGRDRDRDRDRDRTVTASSGRSSARVVADASD